MNGIEKITGQIAVDAQKEIDALLQQARDQAAQTAAGYEAQAASQSQAILERGEQEARRRKERLIDGARMEGRRAVLQTKQELVGRAFDLALEKLTGLPEEGYIALLARLAAAAARTGREQVILSQKDRSRYGKQVVTQANEKLGGAHLTLSEHSRPIKGGLILADGDVEVNCTFETLVRLQKGALEQQVAQVLFQ